MARPRSTTLLLAAVLAWMAAAPVLAIACVPGHHCPMAGMAGAVRPWGGAASAVSSPDCCLRSERRPEPGTLQRPLAQHLDAAPLLARITLLDRSSAEAPRAIQGDGAPASDVPLYTLHSILLI
jgi:hypothetical protein